MYTLSSERTILSRHETATGTTQLQQRSLPDGSPAFELIVDGVFLMASYNQVSERALVYTSLHVLNSATRSQPRILVGGLGMGYTAQEALLHNPERVDVVELNPDVVAWNRSYFASLNGDVLADSRVRLIQTDLYQVLYETAPSSYDLILLDVDNGPSWVAYEENHRLYTPEALRQWANLLVPGGVFSVWSAQEEAEFLARMQAVFARADEIEITIPDYQPQGTSHYLYQGNRV